MVVLHELDPHPRLGPTRGTEALEQKSALVAVHLGLE
jgi:hypothetical protein